MRGGVAGGLVDLPGAEVGLDFDPGQEVGGVTSNARGIGLYAMDRAADKLGFYVRYGGLSAGETAAHIHGYAPAGINAGVKFGLR